MIALKASFEFLTTSPDQKAGHVSVHAPVRETERKHLFFSASVEARGQFVGDSSLLLTSES